jgi:hypothetical protein
MRDHSETTTAKPLSDMPHESHSVGEPPYPQGYKHANMHVKRDASTPDLKGE